jgi:UDP-N-acetylmuramate dehydrogenase
MVPLRNSFPHPPTGLLRGISLYDEPMSKHTSFRVGGLADLYYTPADLDDLKQAIEWIDSKGIPVFFKGAGTNILVSDAGIRGIVVSLDSCLNSMRVRENKVTVGAGESLHQLAWRTAKKGLAGLAFGTGIPGSMGGALIMNAGAWQHNLGEVVVSADVLLRYGEMKTITRADMGLDYRSSSIPLGVIVSLKLELTPGDPAKIEAEMKDYDEQRRKTQPLEFPSAGCIFRNLKEKKLAAGKLIEEAGLKGRSIGDAQVSEKHANFIINRGNAKASEILALIVLVEEMVYAHSGVELRREVKLVGQWGELLPSLKSQRV